MRFELHRAFLNQLDSLDKSDPEVAQFVREKVALLRQAAETSTSAEEMGQAMERLGLPIDGEAEAEAAITEDGEALAEQVMQRAGGLPDVALAILGVAVGTILDAMPPDERRAVLDAFRDSFEVDE